MAVASPGQANTKLKRSVSGKPFYIMGIVSKRLILNNGPGKFAGAIALLKSGEQPDATLIGPLLDPEMDPHAGVRDTNAARRLQASFIEEKAPQTRNVPRDAQWVETASID